MKTTLLFLFLFLLAACAAAQTRDDVLYLKNGGVMRGTIVELVPDSTVKLETRDGNVFVYPMADIERIAKEPALPGEPAAAMEDERNKIESWYLNFSFGYADPSYPSQLQQGLDQVAAAGTHVSISLDLPGVYFPLPNRHTVVGGVLNGVGDRYELNSQWMQINHFTLGASAMHFVTGEIGDGLFFRGDLGLATIGVEASGQSRTSDQGFGYLLGGGYAFPVSNETRLLLNLNYANRHVEGYDYGALSVNLGVML